MFSAPSVRPVIKSNANGPTMSFWPSATSVSRTAHGLAYARGRIGFAAPGRPPALRLVLGHAVGLAHEEVDEGVGEHIGARTAHDLDCLVDCPLAALQEEAQGLAVVLTHEPELARLLVVLLALVVDGHLLVLIGQTLLAEGLGVGLHAAVRHGELERLLGALGEDEELDQSSDEEETDQENQEENGERKFCGTRARNATKNSSRKVI